MSILAKIDGRPLFNSKWKAERWGKKFGITGTHTHVYKEQIGWMAGESHDELDKVFMPREKVFVEELVEEKPIYGDVVEGGGTSGGGTSGGGTTGGDTPGGGGSSEDDTGGGAESEEGGGDSSGGDSKGEDGGGY